ncbi:tryptophan-rich sensory protein [Bacillus sp. RAR_GA_16]|uniref:tryptophan-rich sensory protein n=1 Tax=Bacillus sp. RAR_GA_16 TaxID=2876774 RepID=UPI001CC8EFCB|nr:tryptophan-rich sensory protein [Bacillus sp. RAR_GA_16]MCA0170434.1 tryptophan-rich sensory protein [Bacillus sp. RAR_GA_16]
MTMKLVTIAAYLYLLASSLIFSGDMVGGNDVLIAPAGYTFAIWFVIYLLLLISLVRQFTASECDQVLYVKISYLFASSMLLSGTALLVSESVALLFIAGSLITLAILYTIITKNPERSSFFSVPFSFYLAWTSIATIVDVFVMAEANDVALIFGMNELAWTIIMLIIGAGLAVYFSLYNDDLIYPIVFLWGYFGIFVKDDKPLQLTYTLSILIIGLGVFVIWKVVREVRGRRMRAEAV